MRGDRGPLFLEGSLSMPLSPSVLGIVQGFVLNSRALQFRRQEAQSWLYDIPDAWDLYTMAKICILSIGTHRIGR